MDLGKIILLMAIIDLVDKISNNIDIKNIVSEYFLTSARLLTQ